MNGARAAPRVRLYPLGFFALALLDTLFTQWIVYFHSESRHATAGSAAWIGAALVVGYLLQGVTNPIVGAASDRIRSGAGRRRPIVIAAAPAMALAFAALWHVPGGVGLVLVPLYCVSFAIVAQPYTSLLPTIAPADALRVRLTLAGSMLSFVAAGAALIGGPALLEVGSYRALALVGAIAVLAGVLAPALFIREPAPPTDAPARRPAREFVTSTGELLASPPVRLFLAGNTLLFTGVGLLTMIGPFVAESLVGRERSYTGVLNTWLFAGMLAATPLMMTWSRRVHPAGMLAGGAAFGAAVLGALGASLAAGELALPLWWLAYAALGLPVLMALAAPPLVLSRLADRDGRNREGLIFGLNGAIALGLGRALAAITTGVAVRGEDGSGRTLGLVICIGVAALAFAAASVLLRACARRDQAAPAPASASKP